MINKKTTLENKLNLKTPTYTVFSGNEGYLMIGKQKPNSTTDLDREFIGTDEFLSDFEMLNNTRYTNKDEMADPFKPIDAQYGNEIQKIMYGDIQPENLNTFEHNLSHSEQRMMLYILQKLEKGEKIDEIVMFTGRKCCPVCHEALPKFMEHINNNYGSLVPDKITVYDFWNKREYDGDRIKRDYCNNNYYAYGSDKGVNYKSVFDENLTEIEKQHLVEFVSKINNHRCIGTDNTIGDWFYTVESLKGDSNVPIVFSVEELEKIYNEKKIKAEQDEVFKLINKVNSLNKKLEQIKNNKIINTEIKQLLNDILQHNKRYSQSTEQIDRLDTLDQNELNTDNLEQIINDITKIIQQDVEKIKEQKDKIITILDKDIIKKN